MTRLYFPHDLSSERIDIGGPSHHYLFRVLRLRPGSRIQIFDGAGAEVWASVATISSSSAVLDVEERRTHERSPRALSALLPLLKGERMESCIQKLVELGVDRIVPMICERCVRKPDDKRRARQEERWKKTVVSAVEQCGGVFVPELSATSSWTEALENAESDKCYVFWEDARQGAEEVPHSIDASSVAFATGPEGGLTGEEVAVANELGFATTSLGPLVLRADTASIAAATLLGRSMRSGLP